MDYAQIKNNLTKAGRLVDDGKVADADTLIRSMVGKGLTGADLDANLSDKQLATLRNFSKKS